ncbi:MAG TPA: hypothetical protein VMI06_16200, partial [Terriglobia bacterium]|nr:hypothetical protein [Terriglobia bacterium]
FLEVCDSRHGESLLERGGLPPLWARPLAGARPEARFRPESGSKLPHSTSDFDVALLLIFLTASFAKSRVTC